MTCAREVGGETLRRPEVVQRAQAYGVRPNAVCDDDGNTPLHLALSAEGILSENGFYTIAAIVRSGADLFAVNAAGESALTLAEGRFRRMLARWDRDMEKLCEDVDVMDQGRAAREMGELAVLPRQDGFRPGDTRGGEGEDER